MNIKNSLLECVGKTPMVKLERYACSQSLKANIIAKCEFFNPYSVKDRVAIKMIDSALKSGQLTRDMTIIEPTSGNTGIGLAFAASIYGLNLILCMPESMSIERRKILTQLGACLELTDKTKGMSGAIARAEELAATLGGFIPSQFENAVNPLAHEESTGIEIIDDLDGEVDVVVAGVGTGGTISGIARALKSRNINAEIVAVEPLESPVISGGNAAPHQIQGIGAGFIPKNYDGSLVNKVLTVASTDALKTSKTLASLEGMLVGISAGAAVYGATILAKQKEYSGKNIVVILPDSGERYISTPLFD